MRLGILVAAVLGAGMLLPIDAAQARVLFAEGTTGWDVMGLADGGYLACVLKANRPENKGFFYMLETQARGGVVLSVGFDTDLPRGPISGSLVFDDGKQLTIQGEVDRAGTVAFKVPDSSTLFIRDELCAEKVLKFTMSRRAVTVKLSVSPNNAMNGLRLVAACGRKLLAPEK